MTTTLSDFTFDVTPGSTLDLEIQLTTTDSFESLAVDNVRVDNFVAPLFVESFEDAPGTSYTLTTAFDDGGFDFFDRFAAPDSDNAARDDFRAGFDGNFAIFAQDNDGDGGPATTLIDIPGIDLTPFSAPTMTVSLSLRTT